MEADLFCNKPFFQTERNKYYIYFLFRDLFTNGDHGSKQINTFLDISLLLTNFLRL